MIVHGFPHHLEGRSHVSVFGVPTQTLTHTISASDSNSGMNKTGGYIKECFSYLINRPGWKNKSDLNKSHCKSHSILHFQHKISELYKCPQCHFFAYLIPNGFMLILVLSQQICYQALSSPRAPSPHPLLCCHLL